MTKEQKHIYQTIDEILWTDWDPIGVNDIEHVRDEYQSYTPQIFSLKIHGANRETIAKKLFELETLNMGLTGNIGHCKEVADKIISIEYIRYPK